MTLQEKKVTEKKKIITYLSEIKKSENSPVKTKWILLEENAINKYAPNTTEF